VSDIFPSGQTSISEGFLLESRTDFCQEDGGRKSREPVSSVTDTQVVVDVTVAFWGGLTGQTASGLYDGVLTMGSPSGRFFIVTAFTPRDFLAVAIG
jgi:hypothetical protein